MSTMSTEDKWEWPWRKKIFILSTLSTLLYWRYRFSKGNWTRMWTMIELSVDYNVRHELAHAILDWTKQTMKYTKTCKVRPSQNCDYPPKIICPRVGQPLRKNVILESRFSRALFLFATSSWYNPCDWKETSVGLWVSSIVVSVSIIYLKIIT